MEWSITSREDDLTREVDMETLEDMGPVGPEDYFWLAFNRYLARVIDQIKEQLQNMQQEYRMHEHGAEVAITVVEMPPDTDRLDLRHARDELEPGPESLSLN